MRKLSFLQYAGGQYWLLDEILKRIPQHKVYCEVFGGSGIVLLNKKPSFIEVYNDIDDRLTNLFEVLRDNPMNFRKRFQYLLWSRKLHSLFQEEPIYIDKVEKAVRFFYILETSFSAQNFNTFRISRSPKRIYPKTFWNKFERIYKIHERLKYVYIENQDFRKVISRWDSKDTFFHVDPPYWGCEYYKFNFKEKDHRDLALILSSIKGKFLLTYNDKQEVRKLYSRFSIEEVTSQKAMPFTGKASKASIGKNLHLFIRNYRRETL